MWTDAKAIGYFALVARFEWSQAKEEYTESNGRCNYICGKPFHCDISGDNADSFMFDRDAVKGLQSVVDSLRNAYPVHEDTPSPTWGQYEGTEKLDREEALESIVF